MTPEQRLLTAAGLLEKRAEGASQPWKLVDDNFLAMPWIQMPYTIGLKAGSTTEFYEMCGADDKTTNYIALMHPEVGKAIAMWLRREAKKPMILDPSQWKAFEDGSLDEPEREIWSGDEEALALADLLLAGLP